MDHRYIDERSVAERYLNHKLKPAERAAFEAHLVDCQECIDRLLLAEMFHARNGHRPGPPVPPHALLLAQFKPWELVVIFAVAALLLIAVPTAFFIWSSIKHR
jgi:hypothetical protein